MHVGELDHRQRPAPARVGRRPRPREMDRRRRPARHGACAGLALLAAARPAPAWACRLARARRLADRRLWRGRARRLPGPARGGAASSRGVDCAVIECRRLRRHLGRRARAARLGAGRPADPPAGRARRQRRAARPAGRPAAIAISTTSSHGAQAAGCQGLAGRHAGAAQSRPQLRRRLRRSTSIWRRAHDVPLYPFFLDGVVAPARPDAAGRHPSQCARRRGHRRADHRRWSAVLQDR